MWWSQASLLAALICVSSPNSTNGFAPTSSSTTTTTAIKSNANFGIGKIGKITIAPSASSALNVASVEENIGEASSSSSPMMSPDMKAYAAGYSTVFEELPFKVCQPSEDSDSDSTSSTGGGATSSTLPPDLIGTYYKSGPAMFSAGSLLPPKKSIVQPKQPPVPDGQDTERMVQHPFEGDGGILGVTFNGDGTAIARYRYVRTAAMTRERKKGKKLYSGMEVTRESGSSGSSSSSSSDGGQGNDFPVPLYKHHLQPGLNKFRKNTSNTRAVYWSKKLLTLWEGGLPYKLDALGLSTEGRSQLGGVLGEEDPFSGKAVLDLKKIRLVSYSNKQGSGSSMLTLFEFNAKFRVVSEMEYKLPGFALISDFAVTDRYALFVQPPVATNGMQFMMSKDPSKSLKVEKGEALLHIIKRGTPDMKTISIPFDGASDADLHFCNAFEDGEGNVVFDVIRSDGRHVSSKPQSWPWSTTIDEYDRSSSRKSLWRYKAQVKSGVVTKECTTDMQTYFGVVNPSISGQKYSYIYAAVGAECGDGKVSPPQGIAKINPETKQTQAWYPKEFEFCGEPMYAPRQNGDSESEDDGYILSLLFNGVKKESEIIVFEASDISKGPISRIPLGFAVPHSLYGCFASSEECNWSAEEIERRAKLADKMESRGNMWNEVKSDFSGLGLRLDDFEEYFGDIL